MRELRGEPQAELRVELRAELLVELRAEVDSMQSLGRDSCVALRELRREP